VDIEQGGNSEGYPPTVTAKTGGMEYIYSINTQVMSTKLLKS